MKRLLNTFIFLMISLVALGQVPIDNSHFPDSQFASYVKSNFDKDKDGTLNESEIRSATKIKDSVIGWSSLKGIEYLSQLASIDLSYLYVSSLDLSSNQMLKSIKLSDCFKLDSLKVVSPALESFDISGNGLQSLDLSAGQLLKTINLSSCSQLASLKLNAPALESFDITGNSLQSLDLSASQLLKSINLSSCSQLASLKLNAPALESIVIGGNFIQSLDLSASQLLKSIKLSRCDNLEELQLNSPALESIDIASCKKLASLSVASPVLKSLIFSGYPLAVLNLNEKTQLETFQYNPSREVLLIYPQNGVFDLSEFEGFDRNKTSDWKGVAEAPTVDNKITITRNSYQHVKYTYHTGVKSGLGTTIPVTLSCDLNELPDDLNAVNTSSSRYYDIDGDGVKELYTGYTGNSYSGHLVTYQWLPAINNYIFRKDVPLLTTDRNGSFRHYNNDGIMDYFYIYKDYESGEQNRKCELSVNDSTYVTKVFDGVVPSKHRMNNYYPLDINNDGRKDLIIPHNQTWRIWYQQADGNFTPERMDTLSIYEMDSLLVAEDKASSNGGLVVSNGVPSMATDMVYYGPTIDRTYEFKQALDINHDGLTDLVSSNVIFYNLGNNKFRASLQPGEVTVKDLNGDGIVDYIYNDKANHRVYTRVYLGNKKFSEQTLASEVELTEVFCYDFDKDQDVDILLTFNYTKQFGFSFLVFAENDGKGNFTLHENTFDKHWSFGYCMDYDNDGKMELLASEASGELKLKDLFLFQLDEMSNIVEPQKPIIHFYSNKYYRDDGDIYEAGVMVADVDNDGFLEIMTDTVGCIKTYTHHDLPMLQNCLANEAPQQMTPPTLITDNKTGKLKLMWKPGKDKETSSVDLTYALRIGSAPGKDDIYFSSANADGSRRDFAPGNMSSNLDVILDVSQWQQGDYYVAIQTVDPMGKGSKWSEEIVYHHQMLKADFSLSNSELPFGDTLQIRTAPHSPQLRYTWDFDGGQLLSASPDSSLLKVVFADWGDKHIRLTITNPADNATDVCVKKMAVQRIGVQYSEEVMPFGPHLLDLNNDGRLDAVADNGIYLQNDSAKYEKLKSMFNSNLTINKERKFFSLVDVDMDGDVDIFANTNKGNLIQNNGNNRFEGKQSDSYFGMYGDYEVCPDLNNDGYIDVKFKGYDGTRLYLNSGDNIGLIPAFPTANGNSYSFKNCRLFDVDRDGDLDIFNEGERWNNDNYEWEEFWYDIRIMNSDLTYRTIKIDKNNVSTKFITFEDMNSDGIPDIVEILRDKGSVIGIRYGKKDFTYDERVEFNFNKVGNFYDGIGCKYIHDFDNNGCPDLYVTIKTSNDYDYKNAIIYMQPDKTGIVEYVDMREPYDDIADANNDGIPDFVGSGRVNFIKSVSNTAPQAPSYVRANIEGDGVLLRWEDAEDLETPSVQMRYNVSVKKKGASGPGSYIISPMNGTNDKTAAIPNHFYQRATRKLVPLSRFEPGQEYEIQVQAIDMWNAHSPFSEVFNFKLNDQFITGPSDVAVNDSSTFVFKSNASADAETVWDLDGGTLLEQEGDNYTIGWDVAGVKVIQAVTQGDTLKKYVKVHDINMNFNLPSVGIVNTDIEFALPKGALQVLSEELMINITDDISGKHPKYGQLLYKEGSRTAKFRASVPATYTLQISVEDSICGVVRSDVKTIVIKPAIEELKIRLVGVDATSHKYKVTWDAEALSKYTSTIHVYKELGNYNNFEYLGAADVNAGFYIDESSNPDVMASRYFIRLVNDADGFEFGQSYVHSAAHLMLNKGLGGSVNLVWSKYVGTTIKSYRVMRGTSENEMNLLAQIPGSMTSYTDVTAGDGVYFYALEYNDPYDDEWKPLPNSEVQTLATKAKSGERSNVVCTDDAWYVRAAEKLNLFIADTDQTLNPSHSSMRLEAEILPMTADVRTVNWQIVEGEDLATISQDGLLKANGIQNGTIVVQAMTMDGSNLTAKIRISKEGFKPKATSIEVYSETGWLELTPAQQTLQLHAEILPLEAAQDVIWKIISGNELATIDNTGMLKANGTTNGIIEVRATAISDKSIYSEVTVTKKNFGQTGISTPALEKIHIGRRQNVLYIYGLPESEECVFTIIDYSGRMIQKSESKSGSLRTLSLGQLEKGTYLLQIQTEHGRRVIPFVW